MTALRNLAPTGIADIAPAGSDLIAPDCRGLNFWTIDRALRDLLSLYLDQKALQHFTPHFERLGELAGGRLDELAMQADKRTPILHHRDRFGRDEDWVEYHPAYREMERIGFGEFGIHAMSRRPGVLGWPDIAPPLAKYTLQYLFAQAEFALLCPLSVTDSSILLIQKYGDERVKQRYLPGMLSQDLDTLIRGAQFMTEKSGGSDVSGITLTAKRAGDHWELWGDKWFCSCADHEIVLLLARCQGAPAGNAGLSLFAMPRRLEDGSRNRYRVVRLKDKLGSRSMAAGETIMEGAVAYLLGEPGRGLQAYDGSGEPVAPVAWLPRRRHDAALPQRSAAGRAPSPDVRAHFDRPSVGAAAASETDAAYRAGAVGVDGCRRGDDERRRGAASHSHAAGEIPRLP